MLDPKFIAANPEEVRSAAKKKHIKFDVDDFIVLDEKRRALQGEVDSIRAEKNAVNEKMKTIKGEEREQIITEMRKRVKKKKQPRKNYKNRNGMEASFANRPGLISPDSPEGKMIKRMWKCIKLEKYRIQIRSERSHGTRKRSRHCGHGTRS